MKIGIVTFWQTRDNYGQMLQCLALQYKLKEMGHNPFLIRYAHSEHGYSVKERIFHAIKKILKLQWGQIILQEKKLSNFSEADTCRAFEKFKSTYLRQSSYTYYTLSALRKNPPKADCYIVGSDQVWSKSLNTEDGKVFYLSFGTNRVKRVSYAASFGNAHFDKKQLNLLKKRTSHFSAISVREKRGKKICETAGIDAVHVLDPTMLLKPEDYINLLGVKKNQDKHEIFIYALNISTPEEIRWNEIKLFAEKNGYDIKITPASGYIQGGEIFGTAENYCYYTISKWLEAILSSKMVVTTSFHGVVFCILFHTPFVYVPLKGKYSKGNSRVIDLLEMLHLQNRILHKQTTLQMIMKSEIDWQMVDTVLQEKRKESLSFLQKSLKV